MKQTALKVLAIAGMTYGLALAPAMAATTTFENLLTGSESYWNGGPGSGSFTLGGVTFGNDYNATFDSWSGFAFSNITDNTTPGYGNQYSAFPGSGAGGSAAYSVGYFSSTISFAGLTSMAGGGASLANATYGALSMRDGDDFAKKFGGATGNDADWFLLTIEGYAGGNSTGTVEFYLADFRFADNSQDYIADDWTFVDFSGLGTVDEIRFSFSSSDVGGFGMNTPAYFALDNLVVVPEPSSAIAALSGLGLLLRRRRA